MYMYMYRCIYIYTYDIHLCIYIYIYKQTSTHTCCKREDGFCFWVYQIVNFQGLPNRKSPMGLDYSNPTIL